MTIWLVPQMSRILGLECLGRECLKSFMSFHTKNMLQSHGEEGVAVRVVDKKGMQQKVLHFSG